MKKRIISIIVVVIGVFWVGNIYAQDVDIHGFVSQGYLMTDENNFLSVQTEGGSFEYNELGINFSQQLSDKLRVGMQFYARDLGKIGNDEIAVTWATADYRWNDLLGFRAGIIKMPYGFYGESRDVDSLRTNILLPQSVYYDLSRDSFFAIQGFGIYGNMSAGTLGSLSYQFLYGVMPVEVNSGYSTYVEYMAGGGFKPDNFYMDDAYAGGLQWNTPLEGLRLGGTLYKTSMEIDGSILIDLSGVGTGPWVWSQFPGNEYEITDLSKYVLSIEYTWEDLVLAAEYASQKYAYTSAVLEDTVVSEGYYISASYRFREWFELGAYYSEYYPDEDDDDTFLKDSALSARFDINDNWLFKLEGHLMDGTALMFDVNNPDGMEEDWYLFAAKLTCTF